MIFKLVVFFILILHCIAVAKPVGQVQELHGQKNLFFQAGKEAPWYRSHLEQNAAIGNHFKTDAESMASLRFFLGGKVGLGKDCEIEIITERDAETVREGINLKKGTFWAKFDKQKKDPVRIHTAGGVMGIRGTEFLLQVEEDGSTKLSLIEGSVEITPKQGEALLAEPGMEVSFGPDQALLYQLYEVEKLLENVEKEVGPAFLELRKTLDETRQVLRDTKVQVRAAAVEAQRGLIEARVGALTGVDALERSGVSGVDMDRLRAGLLDLDRAAESSQGWEEGLEPADPSRSTDLNLPDQPSLISLDFPTLKWQDLACSEYAVIILDPSDDEVVHWLAKVSETSYTYPTDAKPLAVGTYRVRILPLDKEGQVVGEVLEQQFSVSE